MKKMKVLLTILIVMYYSVNGQNLVPNNSFENYGTLPCTWIITQSDFSIAMQNWTMPTLGSSDVFSNLVPTNCYANNLSTNSAALGQQIPRTGNIMSGIYMYGLGGPSGNTVYREYLQVALTAPLITGKTYYAEMYVSHAEYTPHYCNNFGMYFSDALINNPTYSVLNFIPQINEISVITNDTGWVKISGYFTATSPKQYLLIGNFYNNLSTSTISASGSMTNAYYYVDDISVSPCINFTNLTQVICQGDNYLGYTTTGIYIDTLLGSNGCDSVRTLNLTVLPANSTYLTQTICQGNSYLGYTTPGIYIDTFMNSVGCDSIRILKIELDNHLCCQIFAPNAFTPNNDNLNDKFIIKGAFDDYNILIADRWGNIVYKSSNSHFGWDGKYKNVEMPIGTYYYILKYKCNNSEMKIIKGDISLIR